MKYFVSGILLSVFFSNPLHALTINQLSFTDTDGGNPYASDPNGPYRFFDVDGDEINDFIYLYPTGTSSGTGIVEIRSGVFLDQVLRTHGSGGAFATSHAVLPDINNDGVPEYAIGAPWDQTAVPGSTGYHHGKVWIFDGFTGDVITKLKFDFPDTGVLQAFGRSIAVIKDRSSGKHRIAVGAPLTPVNGTRAVGSVHVYSLNDPSNPNGPYGYVMRANGDPYVGACTNPSAQSGSNFGFNLFTYEGFELLVAAPWKHYGSTGAVFSMGAVYLMDGRSYGSGPNGDGILRRLGEMNPPEGTTLPDSGVNCQATIYGRASLLGMASLSVTRTKPTGKPDIVAGSQGGAYVFSGDDFKLLYVSEHPAFANVDSRAGRAGNLRGASRPQLYMSGSSSAYIKVVDSAAPMQEHLTIYPNPSDPLYSFGYGSKIVGVMTQSNNRRPVLTTTVRLGGGLSKTYFFQAPLLPPQNVIAEIRKTTIGELNSEFGTLVKTIGDVNGDSIPDYAVSEKAGVLTSRVHVYSGSSHSPLYTIFPASGERLGNALGAVGDVNGDGRADLAIGYHDPNTGKPNFMLRSGVNGTLICRGSPGPLNILLGSSAYLPGENGRIYVADSSYGGTNGTGRVSIINSSTCQEIMGLNGTKASGRFGYSMTRIGDVNADGVLDLVIGDYGGIGDPEVGIYSGQNLTLIGTKITMPAISGRSFGKSVATVGDWNNDGKPDFVVGAPKVSMVDPGGAFYVYSGTSSHPLLYSQTSTRYKFGEMIITGPDTNNDLKPEFFVLAPEAVNSENIPRGIIEVFNGSTGALLQTFTQNVTGPSLKSLEILVGTERSFMLLPLANAYPGSNKGQVSVLEIIGAQP